MHKFKEVNKMRDSKGFKEYMDSMRDLVEQLDKIVASQQEALDACRLELDYLLSLPCREGTQTYEEFLRRAK